jgi:hypothetical protein
MLRSVLVAVLLLVALGTGEAAAAGCPKGQLAWKIEGRQRCVKTVAVATTVQPEAASAVERVLLRAAAPAPVGRRNAVPTAVRRKLTRAARGIGQRVGTLEQRARNPRTTRTAFVQAAPVTIRSGTFVEGGVTASASATLSAAGSLSIDLDMAVKAGKDTVQLEVGITPGFNPPTERCPDANGQVRTRDESGSKLTTKVLRGRKVLSASTVTVKTVTTTVGRVGDDGFLQGSTSTVTSTAGSFSRGLSVETTSTVTLTGGNDGKFTATGTPRVDAKVRSAESSAALERAAEKLIATADAISGDAAKYGAGDARRGRAEVQAKESGWTDLQRNACIDVAWDPTVPGSVEPGQSVTVTGRIIRKDGKPAATSGTWTVISQGPGTFTGAGPGFTARGDEPSATGDTVLGVVTVASRSGRVQAPWFAKGTGLPATFSATVSQQEDFSASFGVKLDFDLTATWTRSSVSANPDGSRTAFYSITSGTTTRWAYDQSTGGCLYHGEGTGGTPVSGDVELQIAADGGVRYGFVADVDLGQRTMPLTGGPEGCPGSISPNLKAIVQARRKPDSSLYAAPPGARSGPNVDVTVTGETESIGDSDGIRDLVTSWTLKGR